MKKILALVACLSLIASLAIGGSIAYLSASDTAENIFTIGNVDISINENGFQNTTLNPGITVDKKVQIDNVGETDAWVWMTINVTPAALKDYVTLTYTNQDAWDTTTAAAANAHLFKQPVAAGANTGIYLQSVSLDSSIDVDGTNLVKWVRGEDGKMKTEVIGTVADLKNIKVTINAYAIQKDGFDDVVKAYNGYQGQTGGTQVDDPNATEPNGDDDSVTYEIPEGTEYTTVSNTDELIAALNGKVATILLKDGEYNWSGTGHNGATQAVSIYGESKNAVLRVTNEGGEGADNDFDGYTVSFTNLTITSDNDWTTGWKRMNAIYNDCIFNNNFNLVNMNHVFNYCTFNQTADQYNIWTYGASSAEFNYCTFNCAGKSIYVDGNGSNKTVLKVNNCVFNDNGSVENKAAIETGTTYGTTYDLIVNNTTVNGFAVNPNGTSTGSTLWANKHSMTNEKLNVVVDGVDVY